MRKIKDSSEAWKNVAFKKKYFLKNGKEKLLTKKYCLSSNPTKPKYQIEDIICKSVHN